MRGVNYAIDMFSVLTVLFFGAVIRKGKG